ncbi:hypothetical protein [Neobacillus niacini]|uniref:hypothetical protein n=1 Tax=Neobacillus niacini TaxID=86668 RepID=UPI0005ED4774|nr:hypothetical protein [Neobacillus niacini]
MKEDLQRVKNNRQEFFADILKEDKKDNQSHYFINTPNDNSIEVYSSQRLPYEPKGWLLEMRNAIRHHLKRLKGDGVCLQALYKSMDQRFFDVENVLFYKVGPSSFNHLNIKSLQFERAYEYPLIVNGHHFEHYQSYKIVDQDETNSQYWIKKRTLATWKSIPIPKLASETKPHTIWHAMKAGLVNILDRTKSDFYGLEVTIKAPIHIQVHLVTIMKPLLDGMISAFHQHDSSDIDEVVFWLKKYINLPTQQIKNLLLDSDNAILGLRNLIQPYRNGVK